MQAAQDLELFHTEEHSPGFVWWHPNGQAILQALRKLLREAHGDFGYQEVKTPNMSGSALFERSGHLAKFSQNMFQVSGGEGVALIVRPMSCPNHISVFDRRNRSHAELPLKLFEFGDVARNEPSGSLQALFRMRGFTQDDSHVFAKHDQIQAVVGDFLSMSKLVYTQLGFTDVRYQISLRPEQRFGSDELWDKAEQELRDACSAQGLAWAEEGGGGAFYGPKLEMHLTDKMGRSWQMGVIQLDFVLPARFDLRYLSDQNKMECPVILHHAVLGSLERFVGVLLEQYGTELPVIVKPLQVALVAVTPEQSEAVRKLAKVFSRIGIRSRVFDKEGRLGTNVKAALVSKPGWLAVIGAKEAAAGQVNVRQGNDSRILAMSDFTSEVVAAVSLSV